MKALNLITDIKAILEAKQIPSIYKIEQRNDFTVAIMASNWNSFGSKLNPLMRVLDAKSMIYHYETTKDNKSNIPTLIITIPVY